MMSQVNTILIVDDEPTGREVLATLLQPQGYQLLMAANGQEALEQAAAHLPDLILLDVMMPGLDGFEVCRRLRADARLGEVPIIMLTALDDRASRLQGIQAGADDFISKPFDRVELRARVRTIVRLNRYRQLLADRSRFDWVVEQADDGYLIAGETGNLV
jgi:DNA-binding response OmpR family regulator